MSKRKFHIDGKKLSIAREMCGLSQEELASRAGCSRRTIERLEQKSGGYYPNTLASIASVLEVNTEDLVVVAKPTIPQSKPSSDTENVHEEHSDADLDEWVRSRIDSARKNFRGTRTVREREVHVSISVTVDSLQNVVPQPVHLRPTFERQRFALLISGEGGSGKTSLICQVAKWAMADEEQERLAEHYMLPVLIEHDIQGTGARAVLDSIRHQVRNLVEEPDAIADELLLALLRSRRLLVIFDHLSEMLEQSRKGVEQALADFPLNAVAVTSRIHETLNGIPRTHWEPVRIEAGFLAQFVDAYLTHKQVRRDFPDPEFFRCCEKLSSIVQGRNVTPLLARLYVNLIVSSKLRAADTHLPENVPDLMLSYVNELNRNFEQGSVPNSAIHADLKLIAWECLRDSFRPGTAKLSDVIRVLGNEDAMNRLKFLDSRLKIIDFVQPAGDRVTIRLDPLAEYMAAFHIVATWKGNQKRWDSFMKKADASTGTQAIAGFLLAVRDCSMLPHSGVPAEIPEALAERAGIDSRLIASQQIQQRLQRSLAALDAPETMDRRAALEALSDMGCDAAPAVVQIIKRLDDEDALIREKAAYALGEIGADAAKGASRLADLLTDPESRVRLTAVAALGQIGPAAGATTLAICRSLVKENESPYEDVALCSMVAFGIGAISALIEVCQKQKPKVVLTAIRALGDIGPLAAAAEEVLCKRTRSRNETIREAAVRSLGKLFALPNSETKEGGPTETRAVKPSKKTIETLIRCLGDSYSETSSPGWAGNQTHYPVRNAAQGSLQLIGSTAAPILIPFLDDPARTEEIEDALSRLGSPVVPVIIGQLTDGDEQRCESALRILARIGHDTDGVAEAIWEFIECCTQSLVSPAIRSLQQIGGLESSVSRLIQILDDSKDDLRDVVVEAIGRSGPDAVAAAPKLVALLAEVGLSNNYEVKQALTRMGKPALPVLMAACKDKRSAVRQAVAEVIGSLGQDAREAVPTLASLVMDEEKDVEMAALDALQNITRR